MVMKRFLDTIGEYGTKACVTYEGQTHSYQDVYLKAMHLLRIVEDNIPKGRVVGILSDYSFTSVALFLALQENKNILVPITSKIPGEVQDRLGIVPCDYLISIEDESIRIEAGAAKDADSGLIEVLQAKNRAGLVLFSSGTTGKPKAMVHDLDNLTHAALSKSKRGRDLIFMIFLMFDHIGGLNTMFNCLAQGMHMVLPENRNPDDVCALIDRYKVNVLPTSPTFLNLILINESYRKYDLSSVKLITYGTEVMPESLLSKLKSVFSGVKFLQTFGTSETGISQTMSKSSESTLLRIEDPDTEYKVVDGELYLRTKTQILGYINEQSDRFTTDGWFKTGDLVEQAADGFIRIVGRNKELINVGGEKVLPNEVETILFQMPEVLDCYVFGQPNPITGQMVCAKILFNRPLSVLEAKDLVVKFCTGRLERYKVPAKVQLMTESEHSDRFKKKRLNG